MEAQANDAKAFLKQVEKLDMLITNKLIEKRQWKDIALGITANMDGERVQSSGSKSKMADALNRCVDMEAEIDRLVDKLVDLKKRVTEVIERLESPTEYNVLHLRFIQGYTLQEIADRYGRPYNWVTTTHGRALAGVQKILDERGEQNAVEKDTWAGQDKNL